MFGSRIYRRLFIPYVLILLLGLGGSWLAATRLFSDTLKQGLQSRLAHSVEVLANGLVPYTPLLLDRLARLINADIALINAQGIINLSTLDGETAALQARFNEVIAANGDWLVATSEFRFGERPFLLVLGKVTRPRDPRVAYVAAYASLADIHDTGRRMAWWLGMVALSGLLLLAWIGHYISQSITLPIKELAHMSGEIAVGNRAIRARVHRDDEVGDLSRAINSMAARLGEFEAEIAAQSRMAALGEMTARIAHEIRNPLTAIKMQLQLLRETADDGHAAVLDSLITETRRLELIVLSTLQHKKTAPPDFHLASINSLIADTVQLLEPQLRHQGLIVETALDPAVPDTPFDRDMMTQILLNLLLNAKDALVDSGRILVGSGVDRRRGTIWFRVEDSGPGIAESRWPGLFSESDSQKPGGFGLGLRLCRELAQQHGGGIAVEHSELGGAKFTVSLPLSRSSA